MSTCQQIDYYCMYSFRSFAPLKNESRAFSSKKKKKPSTQLKQILSGLATQPKRILRVLRYRLSYMAEHPFTWGSRGHISTQRPQACTCSLITTGGKQTESFVGFQNTHVEKQLCYTVTFQLQEKTI